MDLGSILDIWDGFGMDLGPMDLEPIRTFGTDLGHLGLLWDRFGNDLGHVCIKLERAPHVVHSTGYCVVM